MAGLDERGFKRKRYRDILEDMQSRAQDNFGANVNLSNRSPLGILLRLVSWSMAVLWQVAENVYNAGYVDTAEGHQLDHVAKYIGIRRNPAEPATGTIKIEGDEGTEIPAGFKVATEDDIEFETTESVEINGGEVEAEIEALEPGADGNVPAGTITEIINPTAGVDSVNNEEATEGGRDKETDAELKERYDRSVSRGGSSTIESIEATLLDDVEGVRDAQVYYNNTMDDPDSDNIPAKSIAPFVFGGNENDIAEAIFDTKAAGIKSAAISADSSLNKEIDVTDSRGRTHTIGFTRPEEKEVYVDVTLDTDSDFPADGNEQVRTEIVKYIGGQDEDAEEYPGLGLGEDVIYTRIISRIHRVDGIVDITELKVGTSAPPDQEENIDIGAEQVAITDYEKVSVDD